MQITNPPNPLIALRCLLGNFAITRMSATLAPLPECLLGKEQLTQNPRMGDCSFTGQPTIALCAKGQYRLCFFHGEVAVGSHTLYLPRSLEKLLILTPEQIAERLQVERDSVREWPRKRRMRA